MDAIDAIRESNLESDNDEYDNHMEDVHMVEEIPSQSNECGCLVDHFACLNTTVNSLDARLISYGEQFNMINNGISNLDDRLVRMEANQE